MVLGDYNTFMLPSQYGGMLIGFVDHGYLAVWYLLENLCMIWMDGHGAEYLFMNKNSYIISY